MAEKKATPKKTYAQKVLSAMEALTIEDLVVLSGDFRQFRTLVGRLQNDIKKMELAIAAELFDKAKAFAATMANKYNLEVE